MALKTNEIANSKKPSGKIKLHAVYKLFGALLILFLVIINSYILLTTPSPSHYEVSIYSVYPSWIWISLIIIIIVSIWGIIFLRSKLMWLILFLNQLTLLLLPLFRGYLIYGRGDVLGHLGRVKDILITGHIGWDNFYPIMHILIATLNILGGSSLGGLTVLLPAYFWIMLLIWYFVFIEHTINRKIAIMSTLGWMLFPLGYWHTSMVGNMFSYEFMFLILAVWLSKIHTVKKYILVFIMYLNLVYFHPLTSIYLLIVLLLLDIFKNLRLIKKSYRQFLPRMGLVVLVVWFMWYLSFPKIQTAFAQFWITLVNPTKNPFLSQDLSNVQRYKLPIHTLLKFSIYRYFGIIFSLVLALAGTKQILKREEKLFHKSNTVKPEGFLIMVIIFGIWSVLNIFMHFVNFERSFRYIVAFSLPLAMYFLFKKMPSTHSKKLKAIFMLVLVVLAYFAVFTVQSSPLEGKLNMQVSGSEYYGMGWWFTHRNINYKGYEDGQITQFRFYQAWFGRDAALKAKNLLFYGRGASLIPPHFGYDRYMYAEEGYNLPTYFIIGRTIWEYYNATIPNRMKYWRWYPWELRRLRGDPTVDTVYSSTDIYIYLLIPNRTRRMQR